MVAASLTQLLKEGFTRSLKAEVALQSLKGTLTSKPVLWLPDFTRLFIVECDTSGERFGAVLHQGLHQGDDMIAFFSRPVAPCHRSLAAYERELIGLVQAVHQRNRTSVASVRGEN